MDELEVGSPKEIQAFRHKTLRRQRFAFGMLTLALLGAVALGQHNTNRAICEASNRATHRVATVVNSLAKPATYPPGAGAPLKIQIDKANAQRQAVRDQVDHLLAPEAC